MLTKNNHKQTKAAKRKGFYLKWLYGKSLEASNPNTHCPRGLAMLGEARRGGEGLEKEWRGQKPRRRLEQKSGKGWKMKGRGLLNRKEEQEPML